MYTVMLHRHRTPMCRSMYSALCTVMYLVMCGTTCRFHAASGIAWMVLDLIDRAPRLVMRFSRLAARCTTAATLKGSILRSPDPAYRASRQFPIHGFGCDST